MSTITDDAFVRLFQERFGLKVDGWAGLEVLSKLDELAPPAVTKADASAIPDDYWPMLSRIESADRPYVQAKSSTARRVSISSPASRGSARVVGGARRPLERRSFVRRSEVSSPHRQSNSPAPRPSLPRTPPISRHAASRSTRRRSTRPTSSVR